ncbi:MAG TPA: aminopeptidase P family protein [Xanthobacteraceae bacterium]|nr:aminopeptidase P family protein [Xanthobacteraceae bacterium]
MPARFQTFDDPSDGAASGPRVTALRGEMARHGLDGFIVPRADRYQNEYVPPSDERLAWICGFTGSAGTAIVLADHAALFVDGRYTLQAPEQVDTAVFEIVNIADTPPDQWIEKTLHEGQKLGFDPWLHTIEGAERLAKACAAAGAHLVAVEHNPLDAVWTDRPPPPRGAVVLHDEKYAGEPAAHKLERIRAELGKLKASTVVISDPHAACWTFNIRGSDVGHTPLALATALVPREGRPSLYVDGRKLTNAVRAALADLAELREPEDFAADLKSLGAAHAVVRLDGQVAPDAVSRLIGGSGGKIRRGSDPIALMKSVKNATEIAGARAAHVRDGAAVARFLAWLDREAPKGKLTEIDAVEALEDFRRDTGLLKDVSFPTISGFGPNGAIVHYRVTRKTNRRIAPDGLYLVDSGAQYEDGTTDITRTVAVGKPTAEMRDRFTRVLKGHIAISRAVFPDGTNGAQLDSFARQNLWAAGLDFDHGTGHGVGSYLSVHEGPPRISKIPGVALKAGMILSNEPGYYKTGAFGIRIENLVLTVEGPKVEGAEKPLLAFEALTLAPIDRRLIATAALNADELAWLNAYHARVRREISPLLDRRADATTRTWLARATAPLRSSSRAPSRR